MRICLISNGRSEHIQRFSNYLVSMDHEVHLISGRVIESCPKGVILYKLNSNPALWPIQTKWAVRRIKPDVIDGHFGSVYGFMAALSGFHPLVVTLWGDDLFIHPWHNSPWKYTTKYAMKKADIINCLCSMAVAEPQLAKLKINPSKIRTTLFGVDTQKFKPLGFDIGLAKEIGISPDKPLVINVRGFEPVYDYITFFQAIPLVLSKTPEVQFLALYRREQKERGELIINQLGISKNVVLHEWLPQPQMPQLLSLADINVSTSISDGASNALLEAMACGVPSVVTDISANRPWIENGENGLLFPPGDSNKLAEQIITLLNSKEIRSQFGTKCRQIVQEKAEQSKEMRKIENIYYELSGNIPNMRGQ